MSEKLVNKGFNGWSQFGIFIGVFGMAMLVGSLATLGIWKMMTGQGILSMEADMMNPKYATAVKLVQLVSTLFIFFLPAVLYAFICYRQGWLALGFRKGFTLPLLGISILILIACLPLIDSLGLLNKVIPLPASARTYFDSIEKAYEEQVKVIGEVTTPLQYITSVFMIALLPAVFEETFFRGGLQNLLSRWKQNAFFYVVLTAILLAGIRTIWFNNLNGWIFYGTLLVIVLLLYRSHGAMDWLQKITNHYLVPIIFVSILFSAVHASWYGFLPRVALGILLGLVFHYTNNIGYNILLHFLNNATVVTVMFITAREKQPVDISEEQTFPWWVALFSLAALIFLFRWLYHTPRLQKPVEVITDRHNPFAPTIIEETNEEQ